MGHGYTVARLIQAMAFAKSNPTGVIHTGEWTKPTLTGVEWLLWFKDCLNDKINRGDTRSSWRKMQYGYQSEMRRDCDTIRGYLFHRMRRGDSGILCTKELQERYPQINRQVSE